MADSKDIKRLNYFTGQFLEAQDFQDEQSYHIGMRRRLNQLLYSPGIADGGFAATKAGEKRIEVAAGFAIDADGRELIFTTPQQKDVSGFNPNATVFVALSYAENKLEDDEHTAENFTGFIRFTEKPDILLQATPPTGNDVGIKLLIAKLQLDAGGNIQAVDTSVRQLANLYFNGNRQITFADNPASTGLKLQLRSGCGLGINDSTLYYAAGGKHSWRDGNGANERMSLSVAADGGLTVLGTGNSSFTGNVGLGTASPANRLHIDKGRVDITTSDATRGGQNRFNGVRAWNEASSYRRGQLVISSSYSDVVIASSDGNDAHGSTLTFAAYNPNNADEYRKWVINQGNWGARKQFLDFGYSDAARSNPHENINATDTVLTLDGINKRVGIGTTSPLATLDLSKTLTAGQDKENLVCMKISPTFQDNGKTGVMHYGLLVTDGNVGIGTNAPGARLDVNANTTTHAGWLEAIRFSNSEHSAITHPGGGLLFGMHSDRNFYFADIKDGFKKYVMQIEGDTGNVGIGMTTPAAKLHVNGTIRSPMWNVTQVFDRKPGGLPITASFNSGGGTLIVFVSGTAYRGAAGFFSLSILIDNIQQQFIDLFTNEGNSHKAFPSTALVFTGYPAGVHTLMIAAVANGTLSDGNDRYYATVLELPF